MTQVFHYFSHLSPIKHIQHFPICLCLSWLKSASMYILIKSFIYQSYDCFQSNSLEQPFLFYPSTTSLRLEVFYFSHQLLPLKLSPTSQNAMECCNTLPSSPQYDVGLRQDVGSGKKSNRGLHLWT